MISSTELARTARNTSASMSCCFGDPKRLASPAARTTAPITCPSPVSGSAAETGSAARERGRGRLVPRYENRLRSVGECHQVVVVGTLDRLREAGGSSARVAARRSSSTKAAASSRVTRRASLGRASVLDNSSSNCSDTTTSTSPRFHASRISAGGPDPMIAEIRTLGSRTARTQRRSCRRASRCASRASSIASSSSRSAFAQSRSSRSNPSSRRSASSMTWLSPFPVRAGSDLDGAQHTFVERDRCPHSRHTRIIASIHQCDGSVHESRPTTPGTRSP